MSTDLEFLDIAQIRGSALVPSLDHNCNWSRGDAISDHNHFAGAQFLALRYIEVCRYAAFKGYGHGAVVVRTTIEDVAGCLVGDGD